eukprot:46191_1
MDVEIYNAILKEGGIDPFAYDTKKKRKYPNGERAFRHDIFKRKTIWVNNKKEDFKLYITSFHPFIGLFTACSHHPYTKRKRLITLLTMLCVGSFWAALSAMFTVWARDKNHHFTYTFYLKFIISICNGTILFLQELCLRHFLSCSCKENTENSICYCCCKCISRCAICFWFVIAMIALAFMIVIVIDNNCVNEFFLIFVLQFVISWLLQIIGLYIKFRSGWKRDIKIMEQLKQDQSATVFNNINNAHAVMNKFKNVLKLKKKRKCPYYITFEDSNKWIERNPEYLINKKNKSALETPLLVSVNDYKLSDGDSMSSDLENLSETNEEDSAEFDIKENEMNDIDL